MPATPRPRYLTGRSAKRYMALAAARTAPRLTGLMWAALSIAKRYGAMVRVRDGWRPLTGHDGPAVPGVTGAALLKRGFWERGPDPALAAISDKGRRALMQRAAER